MPHRTARLVELFALLLLTPGFALGQNGAPPPDRSIIRKRPRKVRDSQRQCSNLLGSKARFSKLRRFRAQRGRLRRPFSSRRSSRPN